MMLNVIKESKQVKIYVNEPYKLPSWFHHNTMLATCLPVSLIDPLSVHVFSHNIIYIPLYTVEPPNKFGYCVFWRFKMYLNYRENIFWDLDLCHLAECLLSEVPLYVHV